MGGALMILNHLVNKLVERNVNFVLLKDERCPELESEKYIRDIVRMSSKTRARNYYYRKNKENFSAVLCLGNVPPAMRLKIPVHTYIHNVSLLQIPKDYPLSWKFKSYLKKIFIRYYSSNTDTWIVQTSHTANLVRKYLPCRNKQLKIYPFYSIAKFGNQTVKKREDYVFVGEYTNAKGHEYLVEAWKLLAQKGITPKLHLTVSEPKFSKVIEEAINCGANIVNHGYSDRKVVNELYRQSRATIYPSLNESLGLGLVEAAEEGCDIIGSDLPYLYAVCEPSTTFKSCNPYSIADAVIRYEKGEEPKTRLTITDKADSLIDYLLKFDNNK